MNLCCILGVWLPLLPGGYLVLPALPGISGTYAVYVEYRYHSYLVVTCGYLVTSVHTLPWPGIGYCGYSGVLITTVDTVTW